MRIGVYRLTECRKAVEKHRLFQCTFMLYNNCSLTEKIFPYRTKNSYNNRTKPSYSNRKHFSSRI